MQSTFKLLPIPGNGQSCGPSTNGRIILYNGIKATDKKLTFDSNQSETGQFKFLIDTGAATSLIKVKNLILNINKLNQNEKLFLSGINGNIETLGSVVVHMNKTNDNFSFKFNLIRDDFNIPEDGILGHDFLNHFQAIISYKNNTITFNKSLDLAPNTISYVPINFIANPKFNTCIEAIDNEKIFIPGNILITDTTTKYPVINKTVNTLKFSPLNLNTLNALNLNFSQNKNNKDRLSDLRNNLRLEQIVIMRNHNPFI